MVAQSGQRLEVGRDGEVRIEPAYHLSQPLALFRNALVPAPPEFLLDFLELGLRPLAPGLAPQLEAAAPGAPADVGEAQEVEGFRFARAALGPVGGSPPSELDQPGLVSVKLQRKLRQTLP